MRSLHCLHTCYAMLYILAEVSEICSQLSVCALVLQIFSVNQLLERTYSIFRTMVQNAAAAHAYAGWIIVVIVSACLSVTPQCSMVTGFCHHNTNTDEKQERIKMTHFESQKLEYDFLSRQCTPCHQLARELHADISTSGIQSTANDKSS